MTAANPITPAVLAHLPVLEHLKAAGNLGATAAEIAAATDRVYSNVKRDLPKLVTAGLVVDDGKPAVSAVFHLGADGEAALAAMERAANPEVVGGVPFALTSELKPNPKQPRKKFEQEPLERLADTIDEKGILQPLVVRPVGEDGLRVISAGERRWRAACIVNDRRVARDDQSGPIRLPYIERDATPEEQAEEEAYAAYIAVVENGQREPLTTYEEALAYRAMIPALYPSARACGKATGVDGKTVSDRLKALEDLTAAQKDEWRDGKLTWREVRDIFRPPAPTEADPNQMDLEELTGVVASPTTPNKVDYDEELLLIVAEAWDRYLLNKGCHAHRARWVKMTDSYPNIMGARLVRQGLGAIHQEPQSPPFAHLVTTWLEISPKAVEVLTARGIDQNLDKARALVSLKPLPPRAEGRERYATPWLKWPEVDRLAIAAEQTAEAETKPEVAEAAKAVALTMRQRLVFLEATHKMVAQNELTAGRAARVGSYWLDAACSDLTSAGLLRFVNNGGEAGWHVMWGDKAYAWLRASQPSAFTPQGDVKIEDEVLADLRVRLELDIRPDGYTTDWLNVAPIAAAPANLDLPPAGPAEVIDGDDEQGDQEAGEVLERVTDELYHGSTFAELLALTGIKLPLRLGGGLEQGVIFDAEDNEVLTVDGAGELPDALVAARALLIVTAIEDAADYVDMAPDFKPSQPGDRAAMRRSITPWAITCLEDGRRFRGGLKRHLRVVYNLSWAEYLAKWQLPNDYPSLAPALAEARDVMARNVSADVSGGGR